MKARSASELALFLDHRTCGHCGKAVPASAFTRATEYTTDDAMHLAYDATCPSCGKAVHVELDIPRAWPALPDLALGGADPSELFTAAELRALAERLARSVSTDPRGQPPDAFFAKNADLGLAIELVGEVRKFPGQGSALAAELAAWEQLRAQYQALVAEKSAVRHGKTGPKGVAGVAASRRFSKEALVAHEAWVNRGRTGAGRLVVEGGSAGGMRLGNLNVNHGRLVRFDLTKANADFSDFRGAELVEVTCEGTNFQHSKFDAAQLERCTFARARLGLADFKEVRITGGDFRAADADRGRWNRAIAKGVDMRDLQFGDCVLDGGVFEDCDLRGASLARITTQLNLCTALNFTFRRCDLRGAKLAGRRLDNTKFLDCKLHGIVGAPAIEGDYTVERPDFSAAGDGSDIRTAAAVHAMWGKPL